MTGAYERELRDVLAGVERGVEKVIKTCTPEDVRACVPLFRSRFLLSVQQDLAWKGAGI